MLWWSESLLFLVRMEIYILVETASEYGDGVSDERGTEEWELLGYGGYDFG